LTLSRMRKRLRVEHWQGPKEWIYPKAGPESHDLLSGSLGLCRWFWLWLGGLPRLLLGGELLLDLEGHGIGIDSVHLGGAAQRLPSVCMGSSREQNRSFDNQLADCAFVGLADEGGLQLAD